MELMPIRLGGLDERGYRAPLPPSEHIEHAAIRAAVEQHTRDQSAALEARRDLTGLEQERAVAVEADRQAYADALQGKRKDPGTRHTDAADAKIAVARRRLEALEIVEERSLVALREAATAGQADWHAASIAKRDAARAKLAEQVDAIAVTLGELDVADVLVRYTAGRASRLDLPSSPPTPSEPGRRNDPSIGAALGALHRRAVPIPPMPVSVRGTGLRAIDFAA